MYLEELVSMNWLACLLLSILSLKQQPIFYWHCFLHWWILNSQFFYLQDQFSFQLKCPSPLFFFARTLHHNSLSRHLANILTRYFSIDTLVLDGPSGMWARVHLDCFHVFISSCLSLSYDGKFSDD